MDRIIAGSAFDEMWHCHPAEYGQLRIHGKWIKMPRWQVVYGADYHFSGQRHPALAIPERLAPLVDWATNTIDPRLNGVVVNWYDGLLGHYIGKHRDSTKNMVVGAPIVMVSFGATRTLRMRPWKCAQPSFDLPVSSGDIVVLPFATNLAWTHEITKSDRPGRRVSVTLRAFEVQA